jgi:hypothetical protein
MPTLADVSLGFRHAYLDYERLTAQLRAWTEAFPSLCRLGSIARTPEGREVWILTIGAEPDRIRPAVWVDGNLHAGELAGSSVALAIAEDALRIHLDPESLELPPAILDRLRGVLFYVVPRISPQYRRTLTKQLLSTAILVLTTDQLHESVVASTLSCVGQME